MTTEHNFNSKEDREYIENIVVKFNANREDSSLSTVEKTLLAKVLEAENAILELRNKVIELQGEIKHKQSQSVAFIDSLVALKRAEEEGEEEKSE